MKKLIFILAFTGWILSLTVHLLALADVDVEARYPFVFLLHIGAIAIMWPVVLEMKKNEEFKAYQQSGLRNRLNPFAYFKIVFKQTPPVVAAIAIAGFFYAIVNFSLFFFTSEFGVAEFKDGQYILQNHGHLIKTLTEQEYHHYKANQVRGFSGHWIAFFGVAAAFMFPFSRKMTSA